MRSEILKAAQKEYGDRGRKTRGSKRQKVIAFLRANPDSSSEEVFSATKCGVGCAQGMVGYKRIGKGPVLWFVDEEKIKKILNNEFENK